MIAGFCRALLMLATCATVAAGRPVAAAPKPAVSEATLLLFEQEYYRCIKAESPSRAWRMVTFEPPPGQPRFSSQEEKLIVDQSLRCMKRASESGPVSRETRGRSLAISARVGSLAYRGALAELFWRDALTGKTATLGPIPDNLPPSPPPAKSESGQPMSGQPWRERMLGRCLVQANPEAASALVLAAPGSEEEAAAIGRFGNRQFELCTPSGTQLPLSRRQVRAAVAIAGVERLPAPA